MNFLRAFERKLDLAITDWRPLIAVAENRRRAREVLTAECERKPDNGRGMAYAVQRTLAFMQRHIGEFPDGNRWTVMVQLLIDLVKAVCLLFVY